MKKTIMKVIGFIFVVNILLALIAQFTPIGFEAASTENLVVPQTVYYTLFKGTAFQIPINQTLVGTWVVMIFLTVMLKIGTKNLSVTNPGKFQIVLEMFYKFIENTFVASFGKYKKRFVPFFGAMFMFIWCSNLLSFLLPFVPAFSRENGEIIIKPFFRTPTADLNTTIGLALLVVAIFLGAAFRRVGVLGYLKGLTEPIPVMLPLNIIGELAKPLNTSMRLFGNMFAGIVIGGLAYGLMSHNLIGLATGGKISGLFSFSLAWPVGLHVYFDLFAGTIQAYVFTVLSSVYIGETLGAEEED